MPQVSLCLCEAGDRIFHGSRAPAKAFDLRKDEPHPMTHLCAGSQLIENVIENRSLSDHEPLEIVEVVGRPFGVSIIDHFYLSTSKFISGSSVAEAR